MHRPTTALVLALLALMCLPLGVAHADEPDYEAVGNRLLEAVEEGELTAQQAQAMMGALAAAHFGERLAAQRAEHADHDEDDDEEDIEAHYRRLGAGPEDFDRIVGALEEADIEGEQLEPTLGALLRITHAMREQGERFELDARMHGWLREEVDLTPDQVESVLGLARRILHAAEERHEAHGPSREDMEKAKRRIEAAFDAGLITEEEAEERWEAYLDRARRAAEAEREGKPSAELMAKVKKRIQAAVEAGLITEEEAEERFDAWLESQGRVRSR